MKPIGTLDKLGIEEEKFKGPAVHAVISSNDLKSLIEEQAEKAMAFFKKYMNIFAEDDYNLSLAKGITHHINTGDNALIWLRPIQRSKSAEDKVNKEIRNFWIED